MKGGFFLNQKYNNMYKKYIEQLKFIIMLKKYKHNNIDITTFALLFFMSEKRNRIYLIEKLNKKINTIL
jgi:hypothetical protein